MRLSFFVIHIEIGFFFIVVTLIDEITQHKIYYIINGINTKKAK